MRRFAFTVALAGVVATFPAVAQTPPAYDVTFDLGEGGIYSGTTTFAVDGKGVVTGKMSITQPVGVQATLSGQLEKGTWTFEYPYSIPDQGCNGTVKGSAKVPEDRKVISGEVVIGGACVEFPTPAAFTLTQRPVK